jgi:hypothetical protein
MAKLSNVQDDFKRSDCGYWYRLAEEVLGTLIPHLSDKEISQLTPKRANWFPIPLPSETEIKDVANRPDPHIDLKIVDDDTIRIGMRCNSVASVEKIINILDAMQTTEKQELIAEMSKLDDSFQTQVLNKIKETNFAHVDSYELKFNIRSNKIDNEQINRLFNKIEEIREEGKRRLKEEHLSLNPETPVLDIAFTTIKQNPKVFKNKLSQIRRMYEICLSVKTVSELRAQKKKLQKTQDTQYIIKLICSKCGKEFASNSQTGLRFCDVDGMRIIRLKEKIT